MKYKITTLSRIILAVSFSLLLSACGGGESTKPTVSLKGTSWQLISFNRSQPIGSRPITLSFDDGSSLSGNAGCNRYGARSYHEGKYLNLDFSNKGADEKKLPMFSTKMYCPSPAGLMDQERAYLTQLKASRRFSVNGDTLTIKNGANTLVYKRINPTAD